MTVSFKVKLWYKSKPCWLRQISCQEKDSYNCFIETSAFGSIFQSYQWGELKKISGWQPVRLVLENNDSILGAATVLKQAALGMTFFYSPRGPVIDYYSQPRLLALFVEGITSLARLEKAVFWRVDPELPAAQPAKNFLVNGFRPVPMTNPFGGIQPKWVWRIPLAKGEDHLWQQLKKSARRNINKAAGAGIEIREGTKDDLPIFYRLLQATAQRNNFLIRGLAYYEQLWRELSALPGFKMLLAYCNQIPVSTALAIGFGKGVWDIYAGNAHNNRDIGASYLLTWRLISWAAGQGYAFYDLGGIVPQAGEDDPVAGLKMFKSRFGGEELEFINEQDVVFRPAAYHFWRLGQKSFQQINTLRKLVPAGRNN